MSKGVEYCVAVGKHKGVNQLPAIFFYFLLAVQFVSTFKGVGYIFLVVS